jgi:hypothetical protein
MNNPQDIEKVTIAQIARSLRPAHFIAILSGFSSLLAGAFWLGSQWENHRFESELYPLKTLVQELEEDNKTLKEQVAFYREKDKFISLTSTLQFQASIRGIKHDDIFPCSFNLQELTDEKVREIYSEYSDTIQRITSPQNGKEPIAFFGPISRACRPRMISFDRDQSAAYVVHDFLR